MTNVSIVSIFRDSAGAHIERYRRQMEALDTTGFEMRWYLGEGDSEDATYQQLCVWSGDDSRVRTSAVHTGLRRFGSEINPERFRCLALSANPLLDAVARDFWTNYVLIVESDLLIEPDLLQRLYANLPNKNTSIIAPMIWTDNNTRFYDIWAFRELNGNNFLPFGKSWYADKMPVKPFEVKSVGSVVLMPVNTICAGCRYTEQDVIVGLCAQIKESGYKIYADGSTHVGHP